MTLSTDKLGDQTKHRHPSSLIASNESEIGKTDDASATSPSMTIRSRIAISDAIGRSKIQPSRIMLLGVGTLSDKTKFALIQMAQCAATQLGETK